MCVCVNEQEGGLKINRHIMHQYQVTVTTHPIGRSRNILP